MKPTGQKPKEMGEEEKREKEREEKEKREREREDKGNGEGGVREAGWVKNRENNFQ